MIAVVSLVGQSFAYRFLPKLLAGVSVQTNKIEFIDVSWRRTSGASASLENHFVKTTQETAEPFQRMFHPLFLANLFLRLMLGQFFLKICSQ